MDGEPAKSCTVLAATAAGYEITTVEGLARDGVLDPVQEGFHREHGLQCGFCTPGMMLTARALLNRNPDPTDQEIRIAISARSAAARATPRSCARSAGRPTTSAARRRTERASAARGRVDPVGDRAPERDVDLRPRAGR